MLRQRDRALTAPTLATLAAMQAKVDAGADFAERSELAKKGWDAKNSNNAKKAAIKEVRDTLSELSYGSVRCAYCEDSAADEIEHIAPKTVFPSRAFIWSNYCFACGPCNAPKGNKFATVAANGTTTDIDQTTLTAEPVGAIALVDPRVDDPGIFFELDIGGVTPNGLVLSPTSEFMPREGLTPGQDARARWTLTVLRLNREIVRKARETAYQAYRASLREYVAEREGGASQATLDSLRDGILAMPHPTVLDQMIRQAATQPKVAAAIAAAPEIATWTR